MSARPSPHDDTTARDWYPLGCRRDCRHGHTRRFGDCVLADDQPPPEPTVSILRVEPGLDGQPDIVTRSIPASAWDALITVAKWVSRGRSFAFDADPDIAPAYPDASARRALGALHDAGLLDGASPHRPSAGPPANPTGDRR